ncbi:MAG: histidine phosphatase family protein [Candidatus Aenigmarchaeota archaeon]|nr:histidine phosphatase family protein [Candidatus Aenigmarchaeota archaeon]
MTIVYAIRHCDYENPEGIIPGNMPGFHLNNRGRKQAERLANYFSNAGLSSIYSSHLERSFETAEVIAKRFGLKVQTSELIADIRSPNDGTPFADFIASGGNAYKDKRHNEYGGETIPEVYDRMSIFLTDALLKNPWNFAFVSHGDPIEFLKAGLEGKKLVPGLADKIDSYIARGDVYKLVFDGRKFIKAERLYIQEDKIVDNTPKN